MKKLVLTLALASLIATPALAASSKHQGRAAADSSYGARGAYARDVGNAQRVQRSPALILQNGEITGRDPDPRVQLDLLRDPHAAF